MARSGVFRESLMLSFLAVLIFLVYSNTLQSPFIFDDLRNILNNPNTRLTELTLGSIVRAGFEMPTNRPVANISFALNYYFHQYSVVGYHVVNMVIHFTAGIFLYLFAKATLSISTLHSRYSPRRWIPFLTACIWLVHPVHTQSVTYIVQRMTSMAAMFYILSLFLYTKARLAGDKGKRWTLITGCIISGILALGSKEIAATLPLFIFLYEWYFFQDLSSTWLKRHAFHFVGILIILLIVALMYMGPHPFKKILMGYGGRDFTLTQRVLTEFRVVIFYIGLLIFPHPSRLNLDHDFPLSHSFFDPITTLLSTLAIAGLIGMALYIAKKERLISFCILWFLANLVIESSVIPLAIIFEHRTYLPSMLMSLAVVTLAYRYIRVPWVTVGILCAMMTLSSVWTYERNRVWRDKVTLWGDCAKKSPNNARPHNNLGVALAEQGRLNEAISHYSESLRISPEQAGTHYSMGLALARRGRLDEAIGHYLEALRIKPYEALVHNSLGTALAGQGRLDEAMEHYSEALRIEPDNAEAHKQLGVAFAKQGRLEEAVSHFSEALRIRPHDGEIRFNLSRARTLLRKRTMTPNTHTQQ